MGSSSRGGAIGYQVAACGAPVLQRRSNSHHFGFADDAIYPPPVVTTGDDSTGAFTVHGVFVNADAGDYTPLPGGPAVGQGLNVFGQPKAGAVTRDAPLTGRPDAGAWDRGAFVH